jgi:hypothetical protein
MDSAFSEWMIIRIKYTTKFLPPAGDRRFAPIYTHLIALVIPPNIYFISSSPFTAG